MFFRFLYKCGDWPFYDYNALQIAVSLLPGARDTSIAAFPTSEVTVESIPGLLNGFSIEAWAAYGKLKAKDATTVCKESGRLKMRLKSMYQSTAGGIISLPQAEHDMGSREVDVVFQNYPWLNIGSAGHSNPSSTQLACGPTQLLTWF